MTSFTIAHSVTLIASAFNLAPDALWFPPLIETLIAVSILYMALENIVGSKLGRRWVITFGFGLVHGFGFANALNEIDAAGSALLPLLAGFNVGVELAQLGIVAVVLPLIYSMRATRWYASTVLPLGSCALGMAGVVWLIQRV